MDNQIYDGGLPNRVIRELSSQLFKHEHLSKMLYYTAKEYIEEDILKEKKVSWSKLKNKNIFIGRRVPIVLKQSGAFMALRLFNYYPNDNNNPKLFNVVIDIDIIVHRDCLETIYGARDAVMVDMVNQALIGIDKSILGKSKVIETYDLRDINIEYSGYTVKFEVEGFTNYK